VTTETLDTINSVATGISHLSKNIDMDNLFIGGISESDETEDKYLADQHFKDIGCPYAETKTTRLGKREEN